jgi:hypothetical protein
MISLETAPSQIPPLVRELFREGKEAENGTISGLSCLTHRAPFERVAPPGRQILEHRTERWIHDARRLSP